MILLVGCPPSQPPALNPGLGIAIDGGTIAIDPAVVETVDAAGATFLTPSAASATYLSQSAASSTYVTQTSAANTYLTSATAQSSYLLKTARASDSAALGGVAATAVLDAAGKVKAAALPAGANGLPLLDANGHVPASLVSSSNGLIAGPLSFWTGSGFQGSTAVTHGLPTEVLAGFALFGQTFWGHRIDNLHLSIRATSATSASPVNEVYVELFHMSGGSMVDNGPLDHKWVKALAKDEVLNLDYAFPGGLNVPFQFRIRLTLDFDASVFASGSGAYLSTSP